MGSTHGPDPANTLANRVRTIEILANILEVNIADIVKRLNALEGVGETATPPAPKYKVGDLIDARMTGTSWAHDGRVVVKLLDDAHFTYWHDGHAYYRPHDSPDVRHHVEGTP